MKMGRAPKRRPMRKELGKIMRNWILHHGSNCSQRRTKIPETSMLLEDKEDKEVMEVKTVMDPKEVMEVKEVAPLPIYPVAVQLQKAAALS